MNGYAGPAGGRERILTVTQFNTVVKGIIENDPLLVGTAVKGEISGFRRYPSGHLYFTVKDGGSALACVMFASSAAGLRFAPADGLQVVIYGSATVYMKDGRYQFTVRRMVPDGVGGLYAAYEEMKRKLASEGLFDEAHKKKLPFFPHRIGVITSIAGAALHDIMSVTGRRFPTAELLVYPSAVQGEEAPAQLRRAVAYFSRERNVDVLIIGRGGGSIEDLWAFNDEALARALYACPVPTVSAVGHETDYTICDFVCDRRAPTPSAAAELVVPERDALLESTAELSVRMRDALEKSFKNKKTKLALLARSGVLQRPGATVEVKKKMLASLGVRFGGAAAHALQMRRARIEKESARMLTLNPLAVLARGYGAVFNKEGGVVRSVAQLRKGELISVRFSDGEALAEVKKAGKNDG
ncbi:MAG: exodeoxyribonuclease VII large subunit [Clostridia bacterium]|nr:exodeoxyribonuclease VII large subunit [Clostridia bacterium]